MISKTFHFIVGFERQFSPFPLAHFLCLSSCLQVNNPDRIIVHYGVEPWGPYWERIRPQVDLRHVSPDSLVNTFRYSDLSIAKYRYAHLSDFARLEILNEYGGVYADIDTLFVRPIPPELFDKPCVMGRERVDETRPEAVWRGSLCNALIMAHPESAFCVRWLQQMPQAFDGSWSRHATFLPYLLSQQFSDEIHLEPESSFFKLDWTREGIADLFERARTDLHDVYSLHLWSHLWWERSRTDVTRFHSGRVTPAYVRHASSSFAELSRNFLPADLPGSYWDLRCQELFDWFGTTLAAGSAKFMRAVRGRTSAVGI
jgi:hypothetical protein